MIGVGYILCIASIIAGFCGLIWSGQLSIGPSKGMARWVSMRLLGGGIVLIGFVTLAGIHISAHSFLTGTVSSLTQHHGKNSSSHFYVQGADGRYLFASSDYADNHLVNGETVSVEVLDFHSTLLHLTILDGRFAGWTLNEGNGSVGAGLAVALGCFLIYGAQRQWHRDPEGATDRN